MSIQKRCVHKALSSGGSWVWHPTVFLYSARASVIVLTVSVCLCVFLTDLVELMMMQNAQMHQVIINNMTMAALSSFGYTQAPGVNYTLMHATFLLS